MALPSPSASSSWEDEILEAAKGEFNGFITVLDPSNIITIPYDPINDTGGTSEPAVVMASRPARAQQLQPPRDITASSEWATKRRYIFQHEILPGDADINKGMIVRFSGGRDPRLAGWVYVVSGAGNSSHAALRTIQTWTDMVKVT